MLLYHVLATNWPALQNGILLLKPAGNPIEDILLFSPAHFIWLGLEAVWLFFVLSGFVLTKMASRPGFSWFGYYPSRMVRLYGPVVFAIILAWLLFRYIPHVAPPGSPPELSALPTSYTIPNMIRDAILLGGTSDSLGVLWSLQWEVLFSLSLPLYLFLVRRHPWAGTVIALVGVVAGWLYINQVITNTPAGMGNFVDVDQVLMYMPFFYFGALLAQYWERILAAFAFLGNGRWISHVLGSLFLALSIVAMTSFFEFGRQLSALGLDARAVTVPIVLLGILLLLVTSIAWPPLARLLTMRGLLFLGTISFSMYLVHRPVMVASAYTFGLGPVSAAVAVVASFAVATGFYYVVERPLHRLARLVSSSITSAEARRREEKRSEQTPVA